MRSIDVRGATAHLALLRERRYPIYYPGEAREHFWRRSGAFDLVASYTGLVPRSDMADSTLEAIPDADLDALTEWVRGGGGIVHLAPGHSERVWESPSYTQLVKQSAAWLAD